MRSPDHGFVPFMLGALFAVASAAVLQPSLEAQAAAPAAP